MNKEFEKGFRNGQESHGKSKKTGEGQVLLGSFSRVLLVIQGKIIVLASRGLSTRSDMFSCNRLGLVGEE